MEKTSPSMAATAAKRNNQGAVNPINNKENETIPIINPVFAFDTSEGSFSLASICFCNFLVSRLIIHFLRAPGFFFLWTTTELLSLVTSAGGFTAYPDIEINRNEQRSDTRR